MIGDQCQIMSRQAQRLRPTNISQVLRRDKFSSSTGPGTRKCDLGTRTTSNVRKMKIKILKQLVFKEEIKVEFMNIVHTGVSHDFRGTAGPSSFCSFPIKATCTLFKATRMLFKAIRMLCKTRSVLNDVPDGWDCIGCFGFLNDQGENEKIKMCSRTSKASTAINVG